MAYAIVALPKHKGIGATPEVITPFPNAEAAVRFAKYLEDGNPHWNYHVLPTHPPVPVGVDGTRLLNRRY